MQCRLEYEYSTELNSKSKLMRIVSWVSPRCAWIGSLGLVIGVFLCVIPCRRILEDARPGGWGGGHRGAVPGGKKSSKGAEKGHREAEKLLACVLSF